MCNLVIRQLDDCCTEGDVCCTDQKKDNQRTAVHKTYPMPSRPGRRSRPRNSGGGGALLSQDFTTIVFLCSIGVKALFSVIGTLGRAESSRIRYKRELKKGVPANGFWFAYLCFYCVKHKITMETECSAVGTTKYPLLVDSSKNILYACVIYFSNFVDRSLSQPLSAPPDGRNIVVQILISVEVRLF